MQTIQMEITCSGKPIALSKLKTIQNLCDQMCKTDFGKARFANLLAKHVSTTNSSYTLSNFNDKNDLEDFIKECTRFVRSE